MADPYISEVKYLGGASIDFIEIVVDGGTDVSGMTVTVYNQNGSVRSVDLLGTKVATIAGNDVYVIDSGSASFNGLNKRGAVSLETSGTVHQFISFDDGPPVTATAGAASGLTSTQIGQAGGGQSLETSDDGASYTVQSTPNSGAIPCFARGTHIETIKGLKKVEDIRVGDLLRNHTGALVAAKLILSTKVSARGLVRNPKLRPICISAGCLGQGLPTRDLFVSPQHRVLVRSPIVRRMFDEETALVSAVRLTALAGIFRMQKVEEVEYFHVVTDQHEILISEGVPSESFLIGPELANIIQPQQMREISTLFPNAVALCAAQTPASLIPRGKLQKKLIMRHAKNSRPIIAA